MPAAYADDMRLKALAALARGERPVAVAKLFGISRNTLNLWRQRQAETGCCAAQRGYQKGHSAKITDWEEFRRFVDEQGGKTLADMAALRGVARMTIQRGLKQIGYTRKKRPMATRSAMSRPARSS